ncbi:copper amine oxidase N-terminal domain-containing protein [Paenibacillus wenxiniae]|uniref:Copper amine oxidase N-terminal domain-containing protein n=1 Tax=Paenibacillus wenxiniae TaxID=1636843 RepID=A0ABW4RNY4_9BACL
MFKQVTVFVLAMFVLVVSSVASAHPGRTDSDGGHYCRTNCAKWGLSNGEYHYHNGGSSSSSSSSSSASSTPYVAPTPAPQPPKPAYTSSSLKVYVNGQRVQFNSSPLTYKGTTLVPLRELAKATNAKLTWNEDAGAIAVSKGKYKMTLTIDSKIVYYNGVRTTVSTAPVVRDGITYVPAQVFARGIGASISYSEAANTLKLTVK